MVTSDAPYLEKISHSDSVLSDNIEIARLLKLKGSYHSGVHVNQNSSECKSIDQHNIHSLGVQLSGAWDGILLGNLDLLGFQILPLLLQENIPVLHHIGFIDPPFPLHPILRSPNYHILPASHAVAKSLASRGFDINYSDVVYPGVRTDLFTSGSNSISPAISFATAQQNCGYPLGTHANPLKLAMQA